MDIFLRDTIIDDLETLFLFQTDEEANYTAAFNSKNPSDKDAYMKHWTKIVNSEKIIMKTICKDKSILGSIVVFEMESEMNISYWIDKKQWGRGIATNALKLFLDEVQTRPLYARTAFNNIGSMKVLERSGFKKYSEEMFYSNAREEEIKEYQFKLL